jgi:hypothetical protein
MDQHDFLDNSSTFKFEAIAISERFYLAGLTVGL